MHNEHYVIPINFTIYQCTKYAKREGFKKKMAQTWDIVPSSATPSPPSELGTSLSEILLTVFLKFVELGLTEQLSQFWCQNT